MGLRRRPTDRQRHFFFNTISVLEMLLVPNETLR